MNAAHERDIGFNIIAIWLNSVCLSIKVSRLRRHEKICYKGNYQLEGTELMQHQED